MSRLARSLPDRFFVVVLLLLSWTGGLLLVKADQGGGIGPHGLGPENENASNQMDRQPSLSDVWLCMGFALGWSVWMVATRSNNNNNHALTTTTMTTITKAAAAAAAPALGCGVPSTSVVTTTHKMTMQQTQDYLNRGVIVKGNVLESVCQTEMNTGIPLHVSVVDYKVQTPAPTPAPPSASLAPPSASIPPPFKQRQQQQRKQLHQQQLQPQRASSTPRMQTLQIRKSLETPEPLALGFANVDICVLPEDPHSGVLQSELHQRMLEQQQQQQQHLVEQGGEMVETDNAIIANPRRPHNNNKHMALVSLGMGGLLVLVSVGTALYTASRLSSVSGRVVGFVTVGLGSLLLWPVAHHVHLWASRFSTEFLQQPSSCVVTTTHNHSNNASVASLLLPTHNSISSSLSSRQRRERRQGLVQATPKHSNKTSGKTENNHQKTAAAAAAASPTSSTNAGYYVHMPPANDTSSVSSISSLSIKEPPQQQQQALHLCLSSKSNM